MVWYKIYSWIENKDLSHNAIFSFEKGYREAIYSKRGELEIKNWAVSIFTRKCFSKNVYSRFHKKICKQHFTNIVIKRQQLVINDGKK